MALVRNCQGFVRYTFAICYDGLNCLGFSYQGENENCINKQGSDLRALHSVEGRVRSALSALVNTSTNTNLKGNTSETENYESNFENFQVSSRTDRSVHALKNTFHVDIRAKDAHLNSSSMNFSNSIANESIPWRPQNLVRGLNFHLIRNAREDAAEFMSMSMPMSPGKTRATTKFPQNLLRCADNDIRIISCRPAPSELLPNKHYEIGGSQPSHISWNARFTATNRTYIYRILVHRIPRVYNADGKDSDEDGDNNHFRGEDYGVPFEAGRAWRIRCKNRMDLDAMKGAASLLTGTHDFSSFRGKGCYRSNPVTTIERITVQATPLLSTFVNANAWDDEQGDEDENDDGDNNAQIITVTIKGNAFLYRQVRNLVGTLKSVGEGKLDVGDVESILMARDRSQAPQMAPAHGLYLANVEHGDFDI